MRSVVPPIWTIHAPEMRSPVLQGGHTTAPEESRVHKQRQADRQAVRLARTLGILMVKLDCGVVTAMFLVLGLGLVTARIEASAPAQRLRGRTGAR